MWNLPQVCFAPPPTTASLGSAQSFAAAWPVRRSSRSAARVSIDEVAYLCSRFCSLLETLVACRGWHAWVLAESSTRYASAALCPEDDDVASADGCWLLFWQTRQPSAAQKERSELRKLWDLCRWCPTGAPDFESMFDDSVLADVLRTLRPLDAVVCMRIGFPCAEQHARLCLERPAEAPARAPQSGALRLEDIQTLTGDGSATARAAATVLKKYSELLDLLPSLRGCALEQLDLARDAMERIKAAASPEVLRDVVALVEEDASGVCDEAQACVHLPQGLDWVHVVYCTCGRAAIVECRARCRRALCSHCLRASCPLSSVLHAGRECFIAAIGCAPAGEVPCDPADPRCLLCGTGSPAETVSTRTLPLCVTCAALLHNVRVLRNVRCGAEAEHEGAAPRPSVVLAARGELLAPSALCLRSARAAPRPPHAAGISAAAPPPGLLRVRSALMPAGCPTLRVWSKRLTLPQNRDWLAELVAGNVEGCGVVAVRLLRLRSMENRSPPAGGSSLWLELFDMVLDFAQALRAQHAWHAAEVFRDARVYDFCVEVLGRVLAELRPAPQWPALARLPPALKRRMSELRAAEGCCGVCGACVSVEAVAGRWSTAAAGAASQLPFAFTCGHSQELAPVPWRCLNSDCRSQNPLGLGVRRTSLNVRGEEQAMGMTRCAACAYPLCFGRTIFGLRDLLEPSLRRELGTTTRRSFPALLSHLGEGPLRNDDSAAVGVSSAGRAATCTEISGS